MSSQTVRDAFELHRHRLLSRAMVEERRQRGDEPADLLRHAPFHPELLRALLAQKQAPYDEVARDYWMALADAIGDTDAWQPPATGDWPEYEQRVLRRQAEGRGAKATDCELYFEGLGPKIGRYQVEIVWPDAHQDAVRRAYEHFLSRSPNPLRIEGLRSPWRLDDNCMAGYFRRSALVQLFEDLAPLVEDVRFFCVTQTLRYEIWIVDGTCYVQDHPDDIDERVGDVIAPQLQAYPTDEALRQFIAQHRREEASLEAREV